MSRKAYIGPSEAQSNAEALARRGLPYSTASSASFSVAWDWHRREPRDLKEAVKMARKAYADEVPTKLHDADIGDDGTPRMAARAEGYIFGSQDATDARPELDQDTGDRIYPLLSYRLTPFRATLANMERASEEANRRRAAIVRHVTIGTQGPVDAALAEGVPRWCAKLVAQDALFVFLRSLTDVRLSLPKESEAA